MHVNLVLFCALKPLFVAPWGMPLRITLWITNCSLTGSSGTEHVFVDQTLLEWNTFVFSDLGCVVVTCKSWFWWTWVFLSPISLRCKFYYTAKSFHCPGISVQKDLGYACHILSACHIRYVGISGKVHQLRCQNRSRSLSDLAIFPRLTDLSRSSIYYRHVYFLVHSNSVESQGFCSFPR